MLGKPCQVEVVQFSKPYRLVLVFFFDNTKLDLSIYIHQEKWKKIDALVARLRDKYSKLQINQNNLLQVLERCRSYPKKSIYAIDCIENICCICFTHDAQIKGSPYPWKPNYVTNHQEVAEMIFNLNLRQAQDELFNKTFFKFFT
jgi:hypothetical protein